MLLAAGGFTHFQGQHDMGLLEFVARLYGALSADLGMDSQSLGLLGSAAVHNSDGKIQLTEWAGEDIVPLLVQFYEDYRVTKHSRLPCSRAAYRQAILVVKTLAVHNRFVIRVR